jgi:putative ABC transport system ATP-binding protein
MPTTKLRPAARAVSATKIYGSGEAAVVALDHVDVEFPRGRFTAIMGPSGSGKSTLLHCLAGLDRLTSGQVFLGEAELGSLDDTELTLLRRSRLGFVFQSFNLLPALSARENIVLPLRLAGQRPDPDWLAEVVADLRLGDRLGHRPSELSGGQCQRVAVARTLVARPEVLFADEPTGNLDSRAGAELLRHLQEAVERLGQTIVMVTHDPRAAAFAGAVTFLSDGRVVGELDEPTEEAILDRLKELDG